MPPREKNKPTELRYRVADFVNDRLKAFPALHTALKSAMTRRLWKRTVSTASIGAGSGAPVARETLSTVANTAEPQRALESEELAEDDTAGSPQQEVSLDSLPFPPLEMRELVGPTELEAFDNPSGKLVYDYLDPGLYERVFDFGCGCGRVARQLILQCPGPKLYVGIDLHAGMIRWCQKNLQPAAPHFRFFHHDVFNTRFNPRPGSALMATFPVADSQFTLVNALSVFTHLTEEQAVHYLRECARILHPDGVLHASWFFFDKQDYPMLHENNNTLYVSYVDPSAAVIFDRNWVRTTARRMGLRVSRIVPPQIRGHQWLVIMTRREDVEEVEFPPDTAARGWARPPMGLRQDPASIGIEVDLDDRAH